MRSVTILFVAAICAVAAAQDATIAIPTDDSATSSIEDNTTKIDDDGPHTATESVEDNTTKSDDDSVSQTSAGASASASASASVSGSVAVSKTLTGVAAPSGSAGAQGTTGGALSLQGQGLAGVLIVTAATNVLANIPDEMWLEVFHHLPWDALKSVAIPTAPSIASHRTTTPLGRSGNTTPCTIAASGRSPFVATVRPWPPKAIFTQGTFTLLDMTPERLQNFSALRRLI
ncbi:hypothetical protein C8R43DRAFT_1159371 [Mycena crocata]|nr:hypothetical protein C8R43DRAFT_1159371 [Mycena crocata]